MLVSAGCGCRSSENAPASSSFSSTSTWTSIMLIGVVCLLSLQPCLAFAPSSTSSRCPPTSKTLRMPGSTRLTPLRNALDDDEIAVVTQADAAVNAMFKKPLRVGLLVEPTPFTHVSGYANRFKEMLKHLHNTGDQVEICTTDDVPEAPHKFIDYRINYTPGFRFPLYDHICLTFDYKMVAYNFLKLFRPHIIHVSTPGFLCFAAAIYARLLRIPLLFSYHTHLPIYARDYMGFVPGIVGLTRFVIRVVHNWADLTLVTSPQLKDELQSFGVKRVAVWKKGVDTDRFHPKFLNAAMRARLTDGHPEAPLLVYVGRLGAEKKLKMLKGVMERIPGARLALVGGGPAEADLREHFKGTNTVFTGLLHGEELSQAFASADVFLMPSDSETLGFVILESMASGVPVVGARAGGIPNVIAHGKTGFLVAVGDEEAFAARASQLLGDKALMVKMKEAGRAEAESLDWASAMEHLRNFHYKRAVMIHRRRTLSAFLAWAGTLKQRTVKSVKQSMEGMFATAT